MLTSDFSGVYDYEKEEAEHVAGVYVEDLADGYYDSIDQFHRALIKERAHWEKFSDINLKEFADEFNRIVAPECLRAFNAIRYF